MLFTKMWYWLIIGYLRKLDEEIGATISSAWSKNTHLTRNSQWKQYFAFCSTYGLTPLPASEVTIARFLIHKAKTSKYSTLNNYLSAVTILHKFYGFKSEFRSTYFITMVMEGLRHKLGDSVKQSQALTAKQLCDMYAYLNAKDMRELLMWGVLVVSFRTLLRKSNIVPDTYIEQPGHVIRRRDVRFTDYGICLYVHSSKTLKYKEKVLEIPIVEIADSPLCAVRWIRLALMQCPAGDNDPIFMYSKKPILYKHVLEFLKCLVSKIGLNPSVIGLHSLRRSGTQFLHSIGVPLPDIKSVGEWRSMAVLVYLIANLDRKISIEYAAVAALKKVSE